MELMARYEDNYFDLAIVDPPYGIGIDGQKESKNGKKGDRKKHDFKGWDSSSPTKEYFDELHRVAKNCIVWGANYMLHGLTENHKGWIVWDKGQHGLTMSDCELAYSTFDVPTRVYIKNRVAIQVDGSIHPTQKPVKLYEWLLTNYATCKTCKNEGCYFEDVAGDGLGRMLVHCDDCDGIKPRILDTHLGSGSIAIACHNLGFDLTACELDKEYFDAAMKRLKQHQAQQRLF
jgi:site-specific DNA-methyltransferase (adenine-specific)